MPGFPRIDKKAEKIFFQIMGKPDNMKKSKKRKKIDSTIDISLNSDIASRVR